MSNVLAIAAAEASLEDRDFYQFSLEQNRKQKQRIYDLLGPPSVRLCSLKYQLYLFSIEKRH